MMLSLTMECYQEHVANVASVQAATVLATLLHASDVLDVGMVHLIMSLRMSTNDLLLMLLPSQAASVHLLLCCTLPDVLDAGKGTLTPFVPEVTLTLQLHY
jgi:hypothetical protein